MKASVEISMYPLKETYVPAIVDFIERLNQHKGLIIKTNTMSTQIFGDYDQIMAALTQEMKITFEKEKVAVMVLKVINMDLSINWVKRLLNSITKKNRSWTNPVITGFVQEPKK